MTVYRGMDIGTAKPSPAARAEVPHHLLDLVDPAEEFTVSQFQRAARAALAAIERRPSDGAAGRRHRAVPAGGGRRPGPAGPLARGGRRAWSAEADGPGGACRPCTPAWPSSTRWPPPASTATNRRRIVRALEVTIGSGRPFSSFGPGLDAYPPTRFALVGLPFDPGRWTAASRSGSADGWPRAARRGPGAWRPGPAGLSRTARQALGYRELLAHVEDGAPLEEAWPRRCGAPGPSPAPVGLVPAGPPHPLAGAGEDPVAVVSAALDGTDPEVPARPVPSTGTRVSRRVHGRRGARGWRATAGAR